jgi:hypothetical protein
LRYRRFSRLPAAVLSLAATYLLFIEYLPPLRRVHVPFDLAGYHYSLNDYAFQALRHGRLPEWDPTIASGLSFAANAQAATYYPPVWLLYAANWRRSRLSFLTLEIFVFLHVWLAFALCYAWLRRRNLAPLASALGAGVFAFSGYMMLQLQHLGLVCAYAWLPLGFWGVDESAERGSVRPLWKVAAASALAFLAGYPPTWIVFAMCVFVYALARHPVKWRTAAGVTGALAFSLLLSAVQLLPSWEASRLAEHEAHYGNGIRDARFYISYLAPNYFDFDLHTPVHTNAGYEYLYLGAPALLGIAWALRRRARVQSAPAWCMLAASVVVVTNPGGIVWVLLRRSAVLSDLVRSWYFLLGITAAAAPLAAIGFDRFLASDRRRFRRAAGWIAIAASGVWIVWELVVLRGRRPAGWSSVEPAAVTLALFAAVLWLHRAAPARWRFALGAAALLLAAADYKVWGTSLRVNAEPGDLDRFNRQYGVFRGMADANYEELRRHSDYRVISDLNNSFWMEFRHFGLATPQGGDPLAPREYRTVLGTTPGDTATDLDPVRRKDLLKLLGVRYVLSSENGLRLDALRSDPDFRLLPGDAYWKVFDYRDATLPYRWEAADPANTVERIAFEPERREFRVRSPRGGRFVLIEQFYPGWEARVDGNPASILRWGGAFQSVVVSPGEHAIAFQFHSRLLRLGAAISLAALAALLVAGITSRRIALRAGSPDCA